MYSLFEARERNGGARARKTLKSGGGHYFWPSLYKCSGGANTDAMFILAQSWTTNHNRLVAVEARQKKLMVRDPCCLCSLVAHDALGSTVLRATEVF